MKFLQIILFDEAFLDRFFANAPVDQHASGDIAKALISSGHRLYDLVAPLLSARGYETSVLIPNCEPFQRRWAEENGLSIASTSEMNAFVREQIGIVKPDILYISDPDSFGAEFLGGLSRRTRLVIADISRCSDIDTKPFDLLLTRKTPMGEGAVRTPYAEKMVAVPYAVPEFVEFRDEAGGETIPATDVVYAGTIPPEKELQDMLLRVGKSPLGWSGEFSIDYYLDAAEDAVMALPGGIAMYWRKPPDGENYRAVYRSAKIVLDFSVAEADRFQTDCLPRYLEAVHAGALLLAKYRPEIADYFSVGQEIQVFSDANDLTGKIYHYLENDDERRRIAENGRGRCLSECSQEKAAILLDEIIKNAMSNNSGKLSESVETPASANLEALDYLQRSEASFKKALELEPDNRDALQYLAKFAMMRDDFRSADAYFNTLVSRHPGFLDGWIGYGRLAMRINDWKGATMLFEKAKELSPERSDILKLIQHLSRIK